jgi:anti-sigma factor RsiW
MTEYPRHWTCEVTVLRLEAYLRGTLPLAESLAVAEHLQACDSCAQLLAFKVERRSGPIGFELSTGGPDV